MASERSGVGCGKLLLFGEHAAVYGHPACGLTLPGRVRVRIRDIDSNEWRIAGEAGDGRAKGALDEADRRLLVEFLRHAEPLLPAGWRRGEIRIESDLPTGRGFGSSAAWCVAFVRALLGENAPRKEVWEIAHRAERFFHGTPSGIDTGLAILDGLYAFSPAPPALPAARPLAGFPLHLLVGALPRTGSTRELIGDLRRRLEAGEREATDAIRRLGSASASAIELLAGGDASAAGRLGRIAQEAQRDLARLGLSTPALDAILAAGMEEGALGGKLSGAGGGGAFYLLFESEEAARRALPLLRRAGRRGNGRTARPQRGRAARPPRDRAARSAEGEPLLYPYSWFPQAAGPRST